MRRTPIKPKRRTPRRREAPRWTAEEWEAANQLLLVRSRGACEMCGVDLCANQRPVSRHHRQRRRDGGDRLSNLMLLCGTGTTGCHGKVTANPEWATNPMNGWIVPTSFDPADIPVRLADGWLYYLDDEGGRRLVR